MDLDRGELGAQGGGAVVDKASLRKIWGKKLCPRVQRMGWASGRALKRPIRKYGNEAKSLRTGVLKI